MSSVSAASARDLFTRHHRWVRSTARRRFGISGADADDVVQKVFIVAYGVMRTQTVNAERAWLAAITRRVCANERRRHQTRTEMEVQLWESAYEASLEATILAKDTRRVLARLKAGQQELIELMCTEGLSLYGAARRLGVSLRVASCRLQSAKCTIVRQLDLARTSRDLVPRLR